MKRFLFFAPFALIAALLTFAMPQAALAETLEGSNVDSRVLIGFKVDPEDVQANLPEGWASMPFPKGALTGANLLALLEDRALARDAEGKPIDPPTSRALAFLGMAKQTDGDGVRLYLLHLFTSNPNYDPYGNAKLADVTRVTSTEGPANAGRNRSEVWQVTATEGGTFELTLSFTSGTPVWQKAEARMFSNVNPDISRIFKYDQLMDVVMSDAMGKPLSGDIAMTNSIADFAGYFDGSETMLGIIDSPVRLREVYLP